MVGDGGRWWEKACIDAGRCRTWPGGGAQTIKEGQELLLRGAQLASMRAAHPLVSEARSEARSEVITTANAAAATAAAADNATSTDAAAEADATVAAALNVPDGRGVGAARFHPHHLLAHHRGRTKQMVTSKENLRKRAPDSPHVWRACVRTAAEEKLGRAVELGEGIRRRLGRRGVIHRRHVLGLSEVRQHEARRASGVHAREHVVALDVTVYD